MASLPPELDHDPAPRRRRGVPLLVLGGLAALAAGLGLAALLVMRDGGEATPPSASEAGLVVDSSGAGAGRIDPGKPLRCFVQGQFVGELSLTECAKRNGVATDALDVGLDANGALVGADQPVQALPQPVEPPPREIVIEPGAPSQPPEPARPPTDPPY